MKLRRSLINCALLWHKIKMCLKTQDSFPVNDMPFNLSFDWIALVRFTFEETLRLTTHDYKWRKMRSQFPSIKCIIKPFILLIRLCRTGKKKEEKWNEIGIDDWNGFRYRRQHTFRPFPHHQSPVQCQNVTLFSVVRALRVADGFNAIWLLLVGPFYFVSFLWFYELSSICTTMITSIDSRRTVVSHQRKHKSAPIATIAEWSWRENNWDWFEMHQSNSFTHNDGAYDGKLFIGIDSFGSARIQFGRLMTVSPHTQIYGIQL